MRIIIGTGLDPDTKSKVIEDTKIDYGRGLMLEFPTPAKKIRVSLVRDNGKPVIILLLD